MAFVTDADIKAYLAAHLKLAATSDLEPRWTALITRANNDAKGEIKRRLLVRGFTGDQINSWDDGAEFHIALAMCSLLRHAAEADTDDTWQQKFCRASELSDPDFTVVIDGEVATIAPVKSNIGYGSSNNCMTAAPWEGRS